MTYKQPSSGPFKMMGSSPAKQAALIRLGVKGVKKLKKLFTKSKKAKNKDLNPITDPNKAKKTIISDDLKMRTDYTNQFIKEGKL